MNTSAKMTIFSLISASAVGVLVFVGCTVGSSLDNNTDGGGSVFDDGGGPGRADTGTGTRHVVGSVCKTTYQTKPFPVSGDDDPLLSCQQCIEQKCCTTLRGCYDLTPKDAGAGAGTSTCQDYADCVDGCNPEQDAGGCIGDSCDRIAPEYSSPFDLIGSCAETNCRAACGGAQPDGG